MGEFERMYVFECDDGDLFITNVSEQGDDVELYTVLNDLYDIADLMCEMFINGEMYYNDIISTVEEMKNYVVNDEKIDFLVNAFAMSVSGLMSEMHKSIALIDMESFVKRRMDKSDYKNLNFDDDLS